MRLWHGRVDDKRETEREDGHGHGPRVVQVPGVRALGWTCPWTWGRAAQISAVPEASRRLEGAGHSEGQPLQVPAGVQGSTLLRRLMHFYRLSFPSPLTRRSLVAHSSPIRRPLVACSLLFALPDGAPQSVRSTNAPPDHQTRPDRIRKGRPGRPGSTGSTQTTGRQASRASSRAGAAASAAVQPVVLTIRCCSRRSQSTPGRPCQFPPSPSVSLSLALSLPLFPPPAAAVAAVAAAAPSQSCPSRHPASPS
ncbi:hypothetical protein B0J11DRAFT_60809 [Dendryphion nanum]|uniref:Uncharacterized protein n=1 Tax=Dendryphion nanum TaxID=256645 RepID=A0A9P9DL52_9PLEO|nr:hypothetical protein B0J11DRAFT_60809 [Dendryphion nanum]